MHALALLAFVPWLFSWTGVVLALCGLYFFGTLGINIPIAAVARGANLIEKHYTLDASQPGPDHGFAIEPKELAALVRGVPASRSGRNGPPVNRPVLRSPARALRRVSDKAARA